MHNKILDLDKQISKLMDLYALGNIPTDLLTNKIQELNSTKERLLDEIKDLETSNENNIEPQEIIEQIKSAKELKENGTLQEQKALFEFLIDEIILNDDVEIHWSFQ